MRLFRPVVMVWGLGSILLMWTVLCVVVCLTNWTWTTKTELDVSRIKDSWGLAYRYVPSTEQVKDPDRWQQALVLENGTPLAHENGVKDEIAAHGRGYAFSLRNLWFATSDGSDPRINGRHYQISLPHIFSPVARKMAGLLWAWGMVLFLVLVAREHIVAAVRSVKRSPFWLSIIFLAALRMVLVSHDEIVVAASDPMEYVELASQWYYKAPAYEFTRLPVYPLFIAVSGTTGLPLRMVIEVIQLCSYALLAGSLLQLGVARWAVLASFAWMALLPQTGYWNNYTLSDTLYLALLFAALGMGLFWLENGRKKFALACGILLGLLMNVREERIVALGMAFFLVLFALLKWLYLHRSARWSRSSGIGGEIRGFVLSVLPLVLACGLLDFSFQLLFFTRTGLWAHCRLSTPGLNAYMDAMLRIPSVGQSRRYFLLDKKVRDQASTLSPTFRERQHLYEEEAVGYRRDALREHGEFDFDCSSFVWCTLVRNIFGDGRPFDYVHEDQMMKQAAREIREGLAGKPQQTIFVGGTFSINSSVAAIWCREWWPLLRECLVDYTFAVPAEGPFGWDDSDPNDFALVTAVANRRPSVAKIADSTRDFRPAWIKRMWAWLHDLQIACLWVGTGAVCATLLVALCKAWRLWRGRGELALSKLAVVLLLGFIVLTRLAFGTMVEIYFGSHARYMLPLALVSLPFLLILIDLIASWIHQTGRPNRA